jgi:hypothetical protein
MKHVFSERNFQFWEYRVSHGQLLIRSPKPSDSDLNIDVMFFGVEYIAIPRFLPLLELADPEQNEIEKAQECLGKILKPNTVFVLKTQTHRYLIVAAIMQIKETEMGIFESPFQ